LVVECFERIVNYAIKEHRRRVIGGDPTRPSSRSAGSRGSSEAGFTRSEGAIEKAKKAGGPRWAGEEHFFCEAPRPNRPDDPVIPPSKIFDNVYIIGNSGTAVYVVQTSAGLLMIDSLGADQVETQLLPGFQKLGLDPANVKIILVGHGHADHFGGSRYMQDHFGSKVYISAEDWNLIENPPARRGGPPKGPPVTPPKHDADVKEGEPVVLGDLKAIPVAIPGHTPGSMAYTFP
jgi:glyoxylase-like metal-dependent hydrolase (beta-lactamase superfamily II)